MNSEYIPLNFPGYENYPKNKSELVEGIRQKILFCERPENIEKYHIIKEKLKLGLEWLINNVNEDSMSILKELEYYRLGVTSNNVFSVQIWEKIGKNDKTSFKKEILFFSE